MRNLRNWRILENYSSVVDANGREVITGYNRPEEQPNEDPYSSRHARERNGNQKQSDNQGENPNEEPTIIYRE